MESFGTNLPGITLFHVLNAFMWRLFWHRLEFVFQVFQKDGFDYFTEMMPALHNYVTVDTQAFLSNENHVLAMFNMCKAVSWFLFFWNNTKIWYMNWHSVVQLHNYLKSWLVLNVEVWSLHMKLFTLRCMALSTSTVFIKESMPLCSVPCFILNLAVVCYFRFFTLSVQIVLSSHVCYF